MILCRRWREVLQREYNIIIYINIYIGKPGFQCDALKWWRVGAVYSFHHPPPAAVEWEGSDLCGQMTVRGGGGVVWMRVKGVVLRQSVWWRTDEVVYAFRPRGWRRWWWWWRFHVRGLWKGDERIVYGNIYIYIYMCVCELASACV